MTAAAEQLPPDADQVIADLWRMGELSWKLDPHQLEVYEQVKAWDAFRQTPEYEQLIDDTEASLDDVFVHEAGRRVGKTYGGLTMLFETALKRPGAHLTYATAYQKDIGEIIVPQSDIICADAPKDVRPEYHGSQREMHEGLFFPNGSVIKLVGVDKHPDALRGRFSDGMFFSEAGFIKGLEYLLRSVVLMQFQRRPWAYCVLESSTPKQPDHDFTRIVVPDAKKRRAYRMQTLDDNKALSEREYNKTIRQAGGRGHPTCERELFCEQVRDPSTAVLPEFDPKRHVVEPGPVPQYAHCYVSIDPGIRDLLAIVWAYWDYRRAKLVVQRSWAKSNAGTSEVADVLKQGERELWSRLPYADGTREKPNPFRRVSDVDLRFITDMRKEHGVSILPTQKDDAEAQLFALRDAFKYDKIEIWADTGPLADHCGGASWNENRTDWARHEVNGHYDLVAALIYLWRNVERTRDPYPPHVIGHNDPNVFQQMGREELRMLREPAHVRNLSKVLGGGGMRVRLKGNRR